MLAEVGDFGILIYEQHTTRLHHAGTDSFPVVREDAAQVEYVKTYRLLAIQLIGGLHAERQCPAITYDGRTHAFAPQLRLAEGNEAFLQIRPVRLPFAAITD